MAKQSYISTIEQYQRSMIPMGYQDYVPADSRARLVNQVVDQMDVSEIVDSYTGGGTKAYHPRTLLKVIFLAYTDNVYSGRGIEQLCRENVLYLWLTGGTPPSYRTINRFRSNRVGDKIQGLFGQFIQMLVEKKVLSIDVAYLDGTIIEGRSNRYTCIWGANLRKKDDKLRGEISDLLLQIKNEIAEEVAETEDNDDADEGTSEDKPEGTSPAKERRHQLINTLEEKASEAAQLEPARKRTTAKLSLSSSEEERKTKKEELLKQANASRRYLDISDELLTQLEDEAKQQSEETKEGRAKKRRMKRNIKKLTKKQQELKENNAKLQILGDSRNSFSKTDHTATAMRQKDTGATYTPILYPSYNVQAIANQGYILGLEAYSQPTDNVLCKPILDRFYEIHGTYPAILCADAGYGSEENFALLEERHITPFVKPKDYRRDTGQTKPKNPFDSAYWPYNKETDSIQCPAGQDLKPTSLSLEVSNNKTHVREATHYTTSACTHCKHRTECLTQGYPPEKLPRESKHVGRSKALLKQKEKIYQLLESEEGKEHLRRRSFEVETIFGQIKHNSHYNRFRHFGIERINVDLLFLAIAYNFKKLYKELLKGGKHLLSTLLNALFLLFFAQFRLTTSKN